MSCQGQGCCSKTVPWLVGVSRSDTGFACWHVADESGAVQCSWAHTPRIGQANCPLRDTDSLLALTVDSSDIVWCLSLCMTQLNTDGILYFPFGT